MKILILYNNLLSNISNLQKKVSYINILFSKILILISLFYNKKINFFRLKLRLRLVIQCINQIYLIIYNFVYIFKINFVFIDKNKLLDSIVDYKLIAQKSNCILFLEKITIYVKNWLLAKLILKYKN